MTILLLDDQGGDVANLILALKNCGHEVLSCKRIDQAKAHFKKRMKDIDLIITDLNMDPQWLENFEDEAEGPLFAGWVFLYRFVYPYKIVPTIIYSGYVTDLHDRLGGNKKEHEEYNNVGVICVPKGEGSLKALLEKIEALVI